MSNRIELETEAQRFELAYIVGAATLTYRRNRNQPVAQEGAVLLTRDELQAVGELCFEGVEKIDALKDADTIEETTE